MKNKNILTLSLFIIVIGMSSCIKDPKPVAPAVPPVIYSYSEEFDSVGSLNGKGWVIYNNSSPVGAQAWRQGVYQASGGGVIGFAAYTSTKSPNDFISCDDNCGSDVATISAWLITPVTHMKNGDQIDFYTRTNTGLFPDRLQVRANFSSSSTSVGKGAEDVGDFTNVLLDINPGLGSNYPTTWTKYSIILSGLSANAVDGRIAFRYYVTDGGPFGNNSDMIGIDSFSFTSN